LAACICWSDGTRTARHIVVRGAATNSKYQRSPTDQPAFAEQEVFEMPAVWPEKLGDNLDAPWVYGIVGAKHHLDDLEDSHEKVEVDIYNDRRGKEYFQASQPNRRANMVAWMRLATPSLLKILAACFLTVPSASTRSSAISWLLLHSISDNYPALR
jgi:hypothetical protein